MTVGRFVIVLPFPFLLERGWAFGAFLHFDEDTTTTTSFPFRRGMEPPCRFALPMRDMHQPPHPAFVIHVRWNWVSMYDCPLPLILYDHP